MSKLAKFNILGLFINLSVEANIGMEPTFAFEIKEKRDDDFDHKYISS